MYDIPAIDPPVNIIKTVTVQFNDPNHTHNGVPVGQTPIQLDPELAETVLNQGIATLTED